MRAWHTQRINSGPSHKKNAHFHHAPSYLTISMRNSQVQTDIVHKSRSAHRTHVTRHTVHKLLVAHSFAVNALAFAYRFVWCRQWCNIHCLCLCLLESCCTLWKQIGEFSFIGFSCSYTVNTRADCWDAICDTWLQSYSQLSNTAMVTRINHWLYDGGNELFISHFNLSPERVQLKTCKFIWDFIRRQRKRGIASHFNIYEPARCCTLAPQWQCNHSWNLTKSLLLHPRNNFELQFRWIRCHSVSWTALCVVSLWTDILYSIRVNCRCPGF